MASVKDFPRFVNVGIAPRKRGVLESFLYGVKAIFCCHHANRTWPINHEQTCMDCGMVRKFDMSGPEIQVGEWRVQS